MTVTIRTKTDPQTYGTVVEIDGKKVENLISVEFKHHVGQLPVVTLRCYASGEVVAAVPQIEGEA